MKLLVVLALSFLLPGWVTAQLVGDTQSGLASYYATEYDGAETAYGVVYDKTELVAAHKTYPYNSTVRVRNEDNGRTVTVRIVDKGPFIRGRIIELSERAAQELGILGERTAPVEVTLLSTPDQPNVGPPTAPEPRVEVRPDPPAYDPPAYNPPPASRPPVTQETEAPAPSPTPTPPPVITPARRPVATFGPGIYKVALDQPARGQYGVQVGSYASLESAMDRVVQLRAQYFDDVLLQKLGRGSGATYKVVLGPFDDQASAQHYAGSLQQRYGIAGFTVELDRRP
ncbi:septal ring lytic transglycosylase RlpA family protein [Neolewinella sp.]|uniref:septal ring lytic transglycosylase RlpA family protein n=1 Tax=Neolewinella sp. TaxID=2993543 RepID=UPI003B529DD2